MSNTANRNLSREKIQQILASIGSQKEDDSNKVEAVEYNWHQPHYFSSAQLEKLNNFTEKVAQSCSEKFNQLYHSNFDVTIISTTQHFANEFVAADNAPNDYYLTIGTEDHTFGLVGIPNQTAIIWATQLLGDSNSTENSDRDLSQLEQSLLFDIASGIIEAFSDSYDNHDLHPNGKIVKKRIPIELNGTEEFCKITFNVKNPDSENSSDAYFLMFCDKLKPIVGQNVQANEDFSSETIAKAMLAHVHKIPVSITAQLAHTKFNFQEIMSLQVDDVLLLDKRVNEPIELIVEGKTILRGRPAKSDGKHAMVITELCNAK